MDMRVQLDCNGGRALSNDCNLVIYDVSSQLRLEAHVVSGIEVYDVQRSATRPRSHREKHRTNTGYVSAQCGRIRCRIDNEDVLVRQSELHELTEVTPG